MTHALGWAPVALLTLAAAGCGGHDSSPPPATGTVQLTNNSTHPIDDVYLSLSTDTSWGPKRNASPIPVSGVFSITDVSPGTYDGLAVVYGDSPYLATSWRFPVTAGATSSFVVTDLDFSGSLHVTNGPTSPITELHVVPAGTGSWGVNILSSPIAVSGSGFLIGVSPGFYDAECVHADLSVNTGYAIQIASLATSTFACP
jgi:hypothetical protein